MSILEEKQVPATIEVSYSEARKSDMNAENQNTCSLVINIIKHVLQERGAKLEEITVPTNKPRNADIYFEVRINNSEIESVKKEIWEKSANSLKSIEFFTDI